MDLSPVTRDSIVITIVYTALLFWGAWVGVRQVYQGFRRPQELLNPLFGNRAAIVRGEKLVLVYLARKF